MCSLRGPCRGVIERTEDHLRQLSVKTPASQDMNLGAEELNWVEFRSWQLQQGTERRQPNVIAKKWQEKN
jgi:hypothetical protein